MFEDGIENSVDTVGRLDDMRPYLFAADDRLLLPYLVEFRRDEDFFAVEDYLGAFIGRLRCRKKIGNRLGLALELRSQSAHIGDNLHLADLLLLVIRDECREGIAALRRMCLQVVIRSVGDTDDLDPAESRGQDLRVPAVGRIVRTLVGKVLSESDSRGVGAAGDEEIVRKRDIVAHVFVRDDAAFHSLSYRNRDRLLVVFLLFDSAERDNAVGVALEVRVLLMLRVDKNLRLRLRKLAKTDHTLSGGDLVTVGLAYLNGAERQLVAIESEQSAEIGEDTLCGLGAQVTRSLTAGADGRVEHEVEVVRLGAVEGLAAGGAGKIP